MNIASDLTLCPASPNCVCSKSERDDSHYIEPFAVPSSLAHPLDLVREMLQAEPRIAITVTSSRYLHAECRTKFFRFVDDLEFLFSKEEGVLHVRSASRLGYSDLGVNRKRVEHLREKWGQKLEGSSM